MKINDFGLDAETAEEGVTFPIRKRNGEPFVTSDGKEVTLTVLGKESRAFRQCQAALAKKALRRQVESITREEAYRNRLELVASVVVAWSGVDAEWTRDNIILLLEARDRNNEPTYTILQQAEEVIADHGRFFPNGSSSS